MLKGLGAFLLMGGCLKLALGMAGEIDRRERELEAWQSALELLEGELAFRCPSVPRLMEDLARRASSPAAETFTAVEKGLEKLGEKGFEEIWREGVEMSCPALTPEERQELCRLGAILGRYGWEDQRLGVERVRQALEERAAILREDRRREGKVYGTMGLALGAFLTIILL